MLCCCVAVEWSQNNLPRVHPGRGLYGCLGFLLDDLFRKGLLATIIKGLDEVRVRGE